MRGGSTIGDQGSPRTPESAEVRLERALCCVQWRGRRTLEILADYEDYLMEGVVEK